MNAKPRASLIRNLLVIAITGLFAGSCYYYVPEANAGQRGKGSVRHSSKSNRSRSKTTTTRTTTDSRSRATGPADTRSARDTRGGAGGRGPANPRSPRGRTSRHNARYSAWKDARRDYYRFRTVNLLIRAGTYLLSHPTGSTTVVVADTTYYYAGGVYYVSRGSRYVIVTPPHGVVVYSIPTTTTVVYVGSTPYYYYNGTYYVVTTEPAPTPKFSETNVNVNVNVTSEVTTEGGETVELPPLAEDNEEENYKVVAPPIGATVPYLPDAASEEMVNGKKYFVHEGTYYRPFASDGETIYMVIENPTRATAPG